MTYESQTSRTSADVAEFLQLFGPPPVLSSESIEAYELIMARLLECYAPQDFMEQLLVKEIADSTWEVTRNMRHKTLVMERRVRDRLGHQEARRKLAAQPKVRRVIPRPPSGSRPRQRTFSTGWSQKSMPSCCHPRPSSLTPAPLNSA